MNITRNYNAFLFGLVAAFLAVALIAGIMMIAFAATGGLHKSSSSGNDLPTNLTPDGESDLGSSVPASAAVLGQTSDKGEDYIKKIIFVGDSTTYHMIARGVLPDGKETNQVWCPSNGTLMLSSTVTSLKITYPDNGTEMTIAEAAALKQPEYMVLTIGLNGSHTFKENVYKGCYGKLIEAIQEASPNTKIILQSVFPVASNEKEWTSVTPAELNECIDQINEWAKDLTREYDNVRYLDTQSVLRDEEKFLKQSYQSGDGIHLTAEGYHAILQYIRTHAWP